MSGTTATPPDSEAARLLRELVACKDMWIAAGDKWRDSTTPAEECQRFEQDYIARERQSWVSARAFLARQPAALCKRCKGAGEFDAFVKSPFEQDGEMRSVQCPDCNGDGVSQPAAQSEQHADLDGHCAICELYDDCDHEGRCLNTERREDQRRKSPPPACYFERRHEGHDRRRQPAAREPEGQWVPKEPKPGLLCGDVAISTDPRYAGWIFVRHVDGVNWTTGAKLTPETWAMLRASVPTEGESMRLNAPYHGEPNWKAHRCTDGEQCRSSISGGCAIGYCAYYGKEPAEGGA